MDKKVLIGAVVGCGVIACVVAMKGKGASGPAGVSKMQERMEVRMRRRMEQMPEDFPPRIVRDYVPAIKADTARILELLGEQPPRLGT